MENRPEQFFDWTAVEGEFLQKVTNSPHTFIPPIHRTDYQNTLERVSASMIRFKKPEHLIKMIDRVIDRQIGVNHAAVLLYKEEQKAYVLINSEGARHKKGLVDRIEFTVGNPLINVFLQGDLRVLLDEGGVLTADYLDERLQDEELLGRDPSLAEKIRSITGQMEMVGARVCIPSYFKKELLGVLLLGKKVSGQEFTRHEIMFLMTLANNAAMAVSNAKLITRLQEKVREVETLYDRFHGLFIRISIALATAIDARDPYTHGHAMRVTDYCLGIAEEMEFSPEIGDFRLFKESLHVAASLHDIGKIGIPDNILHKKDRLTTDEYDKIREHPAIGAAIIYPIRDLSGIVGGVRSHQERFDGTGYPDRLKGKEIPLLARIISVADAYDAITSERCYKSKRSPEEAILEIAQNAGTQFDPEITDIFQSVYRKKRYSNPT
ncbi:MAG: HD domain-containing phosphohydrolase [Candidatus Omnitrophota bacterium]